MRIKQKASYNFVPILLNLFGRTPNNSEGSNGCPLVHGSNFGCNTNGRTGAGAR